jgi:hypothetical protein
MTALLSFQEWLHNAKGGETYIYATRLLYTRRRTPNTYTGKGGSKRD